MSNTDLPPDQSGTPPGAPAVREVIPEDYEQLKAFRASFEEKILPYWDDVAPILQDEDLRTFTRGAVKTYRERQKELEPAISAEFAPVVKHFEEKWSPVVEYVNELRSEREATRAEREREEKAAQQAAFDANKAYAMRIMAEREDFRNADGNPSPMMEDLIILAGQRKMSLEDAYKEYGPRYFGVKPQAVERETKPRPPSSLRGDAAAPGVPGESSAPAPKTQKERLARMRENMIRAGRGA